MFLKKFANNFSPRAFRVLGAANYARMIKNCIANLGSIAKAGNLNPLDEAMGQRDEPLPITYDGARFLVDCHFGDARLQEDSFTFGLVRELYIRNVYFAFHRPETFEQLRKVVDLGANRGLFSVLAAARAGMVVSVECEPRYGEVIDHNMAINGFDHYAVECAFVGGPGREGGNTVTAAMTIPELLEKHHLATVDLMKIDIEGSEFALFETDGWLDNVRRLSVELHTDCGQVENILAALARHNFAYVLADRNLRPVTGGPAAEFLYAWKEV